MYSINGAHPYDDGSGGGGGGDGGGCSCGGVGGSHLKYNMIYEPCGHGREGWLVGSSICSAIGTRHGPYVLPSC